jgi:hypothetical protein
VKDGGSACAIVSNSGSLHKIINARKNAPVTKLFNDAIEQISSGRRGNVELLVSDRDNF